MNVGGGKVAVFVGVCVGVGEMTGVAVGGGKVAVLVGAGVKVDDGRRVGVDVAVNVTPGGVAVGDCDCCHTRT